jgi:ribosomal protein S6
MKKYELLLVLPGTLDEKEAEVKTNEAMVILKEFGTDAVLKVMGKSRLAYPIKQVRYGYFFTVIFSAEPQNVKIIEEKLKLSRGFLRAIVAQYNKNLEHSQNVSSFGPAAFHAEEPATKAAPMTAVAVESYSPAETMAEEPSEPRQEAPFKEEIKPAPQAPALDLKEIDRKLDEILADDNINI